MLSKANPVGYMAYINSYNIDITSMSTKLFYTNTKMKSFKRLETQMKQFKD